MPNWCDCELRVYGSKSERDEFSKFVAISNRFGMPSILSFESILPYPKHFLYMDLAREALPNGPEKWATKDGYNSGGYEWCISNWGTKWDTCSVSKTENNQRILYRFDTAWSPPLPVILAFSKKFRALRFELKWFERGCGCKGRYHVQCGEVLLEEETEYSGSRGG